jgi:hypothetical protein
VKLRVAESDSLQLTGMIIGMGVPRSLVLAFKVSVVYAFVAEINCNLLRSPDILEYRMLQDG